MIAPPIYDFPQTDTRRGEALMADAKANALEVCGRSPKRLWSAMRPPWIGGCHGEH